MPQPFGIDARAWPRLSPLLDQVLDLPAARRGHWFEALGAEFDDCKPALRRWLEHDAANPPRALLNTLPKLQDAVPSQGPGADLHAAGDRVGPYCLCTRLGMGGMGVVWLAERADGLIARPVALKLPRKLLQPGCDGARRMARERRILAALDHPNIARLYDVGLSDDGQPWLALEHVEGDPIDRHCERRGLGLAARLRLFLQAADAVVHAHGRLVVHSDLKPSNILVTDGGEVRLLDFGIASLLGEDLAAAPGPGDLSGPALTPGYAAPEQWSGEPVGVACDVYSLGVLLHQLLCGQRPAAPGSDGAAARPSAVATTAWRPALRGDLDAILALALQPRPERRYASVQALADDVRSSLARRPVQARCGGWVYRGTRFVQRHTPAVLAATLALGALSATTIFSLQQWQAARAERTQALQVKDFVVATLQQANPYVSGSREASLPALLGEARTRLAQWTGASPATRVELLNVIGWNEASMGRLDQAEAVAEQALREARGGLPPGHAQRLGAQVLGVVVKRLRGDFEGAREALVPTLAALRPRRAEQPEDLVRALRNSSNIALHEDDPATALRDAREAVALSVAHYGERHHETLTSYSVLAMAALAAQEPHEALAVARRAEALAVALFGSASPHARTIEVRSTLARAHAAAGQFEPALALMQRCLADAQALHGAASMEAGIHHRTLARMWLDAGRPERAAAHADAALQILATRAGPASALVVDAQRLREKVALAEGLPPGQGMRVSAEKPGGFALPSGAAPRLPAP